MATKKQKREAAEAKRKIFDAKVLADGLEAQRAGKERERQKREVIALEVDAVKARLRGQLVKNGIDPDTGEKLKGRRGQRPIVMETGEALRFATALNAGGFFEKLSGRPAQSGDGWADGRDDFF